MTRMASPRIERNTVNLGPLSLFKRMHSNGTPINSYVIASWHWPWSLTWRWTLVRAPWYKPPGVQGFSLMRMHRGRGFNFLACFNTKLTGHWSIQTQPNMDQRKKKGTK